ncbi:transcriptional regulator [Mesobaculum littorinae]|uniref:Transcriptional regulator n=1 Tax=Mesobaculum littorinae TaxID=2486419 RepID=A0A438AGR5_9RHOB|nr:metalloregulator ArsR/SmtB family transcription factor [Mesobaculum littorinae]RVV97899.1 transcriptional regulator [Mesobaculum littorinae]
MPLTDIPPHELERRAEMVAQRLSLVANTKRLLILCQLTAGERSVSTLAEDISLGQSALSQHLARLREAGMVATRRDGQTIYYRLADVQMELLINAICNYGPPTDRPPLSPDDDDPTPDDR